MFFGVFGLKLGDEQLLLQLQEDDSYAMNEPKITQGTGDFFLHSRKLT